MFSWLEQGVDFAGNARDRVFVVVVRREQKICWQGVIGRSFRLDDWQLFRKILLPAAMPSIFVGLRVGLIFALINIVGVEFLINFGGLGQLINELAERYDLPGTYGAIGFVILVSVLFFVVCERVERWLLPG